MKQVVSKITETLFNQIKTELEFIDPTTAAMKNHLSVKTILQIKGSEDFEDYEAQKRAQHPISKQIPIRELLIEMDKKLNSILSYAKENRLL